MAHIRITREFSFEMAHALLEYNGPCRSIHGHSYRLFVTLFGEPVVNPGAPDDGMIMDFHELKILIKNILDEFDHALVLNAATPAAVLDGLKGFNNVVLLPYQPTCENLLLDIAMRVQKELPEGILLHSLKLHETGNSSAEWHASDNP